MSVQPINFILSTDFPAFKNDANATGVITVSGGLVVGGNAVLTASADFTMGTTGAIARARWASTAESNLFTIGEYRIYNRTGTVGGVASPYSFGVFLLRTSANNLRLQFVLPNPYGSTLTGAAAETITMYVNTFIAPYTT